MERFTDKQLVAKLKAEDKSIFPEIMNRFEPMIFQLALKLTKNESDAEDVVQDVFLTILEKIDSFREEAAFSSWIYRVTVNASLMKLRRRREKQWEPVDEDLPKFLEEGHFANPVVDGSEHPDRLALNSEARGMINSAVGELPDKYRLPFILQNIEDLSLKEIGDMLNLTIPTVKIRLHRARLFLRERLASYYMDTELDHSLSLGHLS